MDGGCPCMGQGQHGRCPQAVCARITSSPPVLPPKCLCGEQSSPPAPMGWAPPRCPPGTAGRGGTPSASPAPAACPPPECLVKENAREHFRSRQESR